MMACLHVFLFDRVWTGGDMEKIQDVCVVGSGITAAALVWVLTRYGGVKRIVMCERRGDFALVNSHPRSNSHTPHTGEIESFYTKERALFVKERTELLLGYVQRFAPAAFVPMHKQLLGVGEEESEIVVKRFFDLGKYYPDILLLDRHAIEQVEPRLVEGRARNERIVSLYTSRGGAVDFRRVTKSFLEEASAEQTHIDVRFDTDVNAIERTSDGFLVRTNGSNIRARTVVVCAGSASLLFAHRMGLGKNLVLFPVLGNFYRVRGKLNGKVYTVQGNPKIPFVSLNANPAVYDRSETRIGPTTSLTCFLENGSWKSALEFLKSGTLTPRGMYGLLQMISDPDLFGFGVKNALYEVPLIGKGRLANDVRKIFPSVRADDLTFDRGAGGVRGQPIDLLTGRMAIGSEKIIAPHDPIIFTMSPSPGGSCCIGSAIEDARHVISWLGEPYRFEEDRLRQELAYSGS